MTEAYVLETRNLVKEFKGFVAVNDVNLKIRQGDIHALIGPNGAGKTTVFNLLTKFLIPTRGQILYKGEDITALKSATIARRGVVRSFQISAVFPHMTALENIRVALQSFEGNSYRFWQSGRRLNRLNERAMELLDAGEPLVVTVDVQVRGEGEEPRLTALSVKSLEDEAAHAADGMEVYLATPDCVEHLSNLLHQHGKRGRGRVTIQLKDRPEGDIEIELGETFKIDGRLPR